MSNSNYPPIHYLIEEMKVKGINVFEANIGPADAMYLLGKSKGNRSLNQADINQYAEDMRQGKWYAGNDAILISTDDTLMNYHHRNYAIIQSGCTVPCLVRINVKPEEAMHIDTGRKRSVVDAKAFDNTLDYIDQENSVIARTCLTDGGSAFADRDTGNRAITNWIAKYKSHIDKVRFDFFENKKINKITQSVVLASFVLALINDKDEQSLREAAKFLLSPIDYPLSGNGAGTLHKLRDLLLSGEAASDFGGGSGRKGIFHITCIFINRYLENVVDKDSKEIKNKPSKATVKKQRNLFPCPDVKKFVKTDHALMFHIRVISEKLTSYSVVTPADMAERIVANGYNLKSKNLEKLVAKKFAKLFKDTCSDLDVGVGVFTPLEEDGKKRISNYEFKKKLTV